VKIFNRYRSLYDLALPLGDIIFAVLSIGAVRSSMVMINQPSSEEWSGWIVQSVTVAAFVLLSFYFADLYAVNTTLTIRDRLLSLMKGFGLVCLLTGIFSLLMPTLGFEDIRLVDLMLLGSALFLWHQVFAKGLKHGPIMSKVLIVGTHGISKLIAEQLHAKKHLRMEVVGFVGSRDDSITLSCGDRQKVLQRVFPHDAIRGLVDTQSVDTILIDGPGGCADLPAQDLVTLRLRGTKFEDCHSFYERVMSQIPITDLHPSWVVLASGFRRSLWVRLVKRTMDLVFSIICLILFAPLFLLAAVAIKLNSRGPVFYSQERAGLDERPFTLYKFRSMFADAETESGPVWAGSDDPRVTGVGKILRKFRIDELPQLVNVLRGEMSMVGPRPERPFFIAKFKETVPYYHLRFAVKPGITGWAQISFPYAATDDDAIQKLEYELYYIKNISPLFDLEILLLTIKTVLLGRGSQ
jgi:sugar transferase (PEP-CTERM system associated)